MKLDILLPTNLSHIHIPLIGVLGDWSIIQSLSTGFVAFVTARFIIKKWRDRKLPPGPWRIPFIGTPGYSGPDAYKKYMENRNVYGDLQSYYDGNRLMITVNGSRAVHEMLVERGDEFANRPFVSPKFPHSIDHEDELFIVNFSEAFKRNKKFAMRAMREFGAGDASLEDKIKMEINQMLERLDAYGGTPFDIHALFNNALARIITSVIINIDFRDDEEVMKLINATQDWVNCFLTEPPLLWTILPESLQKIIYPSYHRMMLRNKDLRNFMFEKIGQHRQTIDPDNLRDVTDVYLKAREGPEMDTALLTNTLLMMMPDNVDAGGCAMTYILGFLARHQEEQKKIHQELDNVVGRDYEPTRQHKRDLVYMEACIHECLRLASIFPLVSHQPTHDVIFDDFLLPKESWILPNYYSVHMDPNTFPDPQHFNPERFLNEKGELTNMTNFVLFGIGRRACVGEPLVRMELFLFIACLLHHFSFSFPEDEPTFDPAEECEEFGGVILTMRRPRKFRLCAKPR